ncbi:unnamed protein product [Rhizopus stolonifer]
MCNQMSNFNSINIPQTTMHSDYDFSGVLLSEELQKKNINTFINKLFSMISDSYCQGLIYWSSTGASFFISNVPSFSKRVLPVYFKHSKYSSFVRQLNMYGFHKVNKSCRGQRNNNEFELWEFSHPRFQRNRPDLLEGIRRQSMDSETLRRETNDMHATTASIKMSQTNIMDQFQKLQQEHSILLNALIETKRVQLEQQTLIEKLLQQNQKMEQDILFTQLPPQKLQDTLFNYLPSSPVSTNYPITNALN